MFSTFNFSSFPNLWLQEHHYCKSFMHDVVEGTYHTHPKLADSKIRSRKQDSEVSSLSYAFPDFATMQNAFLLLIERSVTEISCLDGQR